MSYEIIGNRQVVADSIRYDNIAVLFPLPEHDIKIEPKFDDHKFDVVGLAPIMMRCENDTPIFQRLNDLQKKLASPENSSELPIIQEKVKKLNDLLNETKKITVHVIAINRLVPAGEVVSCRNVLEKLNFAIELFNDQIDGATVDGVEVKHQDINILDVKFRKSIGDNWQQAECKNFRDTSLSTVAKNGDYTEALRILPDKPYYIFVQNTEGKTPLVIAAEANKYEFITEVLKASTDYINPSDINEKPIVDAINNSSMTNGQKRELSTLILRLKISTT